MKKGLLIVAVIGAIGGSFFVPYTARAFVTIANQPTVDAYTIAEGSFSGPYQTLGTGLSGIPEQIIVGLFTNQPFSGGVSFGIVIYECTGNHTGCSVFAEPVSYFDLDQFTETGENYHLVTFDYPIDTNSLNPTKYYEFRINGSGSGSTGTFPHWTGSTNASSYPNGSFNSGGQNSIANLADLRFSITGIGTASESAYVYDLTPRNGSTTPSTTVPFSFSYNAPASKNISEYAIVYTDITNTGGSPITVFGTASSGVHTVNRNIILTDGHLYSWLAYICDNQGTCWSGAPSAVFGVGTTSLDNLNQFFYTGPTGTDVATSSADFYGAIPLISAIANKVPFGYVLQITNAITDSLNVDVSATSSLLYLDLHTSNIGTSSPIGRVIPIISLTPDDIITTMGEENYNLLFSMQTISLWVGAVFYVWGRAKKAVAMIK